MLTNTNLISVAILLILSGVCGLVESQAGQVAVDQTLYAELLRQHVTDGVVDYRGFKRDEAKLDRYLSLLSQVDPQTLTRDERFAFYINAYNAWTIKLILSRYPNVKSIKDLGSLLRSPWKKKIAKINGDVLTLDALEHDILRPQFQDPRVHFAVNCASKGCPPLLNEPYTGQRLNDQLNRVAGNFINDPKRNYLEGDVLYVSRIFKWFAPDFNNDVMAFFQRYANGSLKTKLNATASRIRVEYLDYDWSLNGF